MNKVKVCNVKCEGCARTIIDSLERIDVKNVSLNLKENEISFNGDAKVVSAELSRLGYPIVGTKEESDFFKKIQKFFSCLKGKIKNWRKA